MGAPVDEELLGLVHQTGSLLLQEAARPIVQPLGEGGDQIALGTSAP